MSDSPMYVYRGEALANYGFGDEHPFGIHTSAIIRRRDDLPEPLSPRTPIFAPGKKLKEMSRRMNRLGGTIFATRFIV